GQAGRYYRVHAVSASCETVWAEAAHQLDREHDREDRRAFRRFRGLNRHPLDASRRELSDGGVERRCNGCVERRIPADKASETRQPDRSGNMFRHMQQAMHYHRRRHHRDPSWLPPGKALQMCMIDGARALGMEDNMLDRGRQEGRPDAGRHAPPAPLPGQHARQPRGDFANGNDLHTVICDGRVLMRGREVLSVNQDAVLDAAQRETELMLERVETPETFWNALQMGGGPA
nr:hypothetical protein [Paracoccaceae bacterium]